MSFFWRVSCGECSERVAVGEIWYLRFWCCGINIRIIVVEFVFGESIYLICLFRLLT